MPTKSSRVPGHAATIDAPGLHGFQGLASMIYHDDGITILAPGWEFEKQTEYLMKIFFAMMRHFVNTSTEELEAGAQMDECKSMNYLGARLYTGARVKKNRSRALKLWTKVSQIDLPRGASITSSDYTARSRARVKADAYAYLCAHHLRNYEKSKALLDLAQAFLCGEGAAKLGLFVAASHYTALAFYNLQKGAPVRIEDDVSIETKCSFNCTPENAPAFAIVLQCKTMLDGKLWADFSAPEEMEPVEYACSRAGCDETSAARADMKRCAGTCDVASKPSYCSQHCQALDWERHGMHCSRPTEADLTFQYTPLATNDSKLVDTSRLNSVDRARARDLASIDLWSHLGGDNPTPKEKAIREFIREIEETACGGPRSTGQFVKLVKNMSKTIPQRDLETLFKAGAPSVPV
ncbi:unnamed protein product [Peniophora sp. CBMAI 1063]|nr:unnamed protein product [Peniophora sp. CBMAI 1063]